MEYDYDVAGREDANASGSRGRACGRIDDLLPGKKLSEVYVRSGTWEYILKAGVVSMLALVVDACTRNPDNISSVFVGMLCIAPGVSQSGRIAGSIYLASIVGTLIGTLLSIPVYELDSSSTLDIHSRQYQVVADEIDVRNGNDGFVLAVLVPLILRCTCVGVGVAITLFALFRAHWTSPEQVTSGLFSVIFVQLVPLIWPPLQRYGSFIIISLLLVIVSMIRNLYHPTYVTTSPYCLLFDISYLSRDLYASSLYLIPPLSTNHDTVYTTSTWSIYYISLIV